MFCKNCGANLPDTAAFCANCGTRVEAPVPPAPPAPRQPVGAGFYQNPEQGFGQAYVPETNSERRQTTADAMSIVALCAGGTSAILAIIALIRGLSLMVRTLSEQGLASLIQQGISFITNALTGQEPKNPGIGIIVLAAVAFAIGLFALILGKRRASAVGQNGYAKYGCILGLCGVIIGGAALVFAVVGAIRYNTLLKEVDLNNYDLFDYFDLDEWGSLFDDWF